MPFSLRDPLLHWGFLVVAIELDVSTSFSRAPLQIFMFFCVGRPFLSSFGPRISVHARLNVQLAAIYRDGAHFRRSDTQRIRTKEEMSQNLRT